MSTNINLIGVSARKRMGKDTFFEIFNDFAGNIYECKKFAGKLKTICSIITGKPEYKFYDGSYCEEFLPEWNLTIREIQQKIGTELFRDSLNEDVWVKSLFVDFEQTSKWIITDVRFPNEIESIKSNGGIVVRIINPNVKDLSNHASETSLDNYKDWDYIIYNDGTLDDYKIKIKELYNKTKGDTNDTFTS